MTTELQKIDQQKLDQMRENANQMPGLDLTYINFNGRDGVFNKTTGEKDEDGKSIKEEIGDSFTACILMMRNRANKFDPQHPDKNMRSDEFDNMQEEITIKDNDGKPIESGNYAKLKMKYDIGLEKILYLISPDTEKIAKMTVRGSSLVSLFNYTKFFKDDCFSRFITKFGCKDAKNNYGEFKVMTFEKCDTMDIDKVLAWQSNLKKAIGVFEETKKEMVEVVDDSEIASYVDNIPFN